MSEDEAIWSDLQNHATKRAFQAAKPIVAMCDASQRAALYAAIGLEFYIQAAANFSAASGEPGPESPLEMALTTANYMRAMASLIEQDPADIKFAGVQS